jgi:hypothetical protein
VTTGDPGWVYLLHFEHEIGSEDNPRGRAGHYLGWSGRDDLEARLAEHRAGRGARLTEVLKERGISWTLARTWPGGPELEKALKERHATNRMCPECQPNPEPGTTRKLPPVRPARRTPEHRAPDPAPPVRKVSPYSQGTRMAGSVVGRLIAAGQTAAQIQAHHEYSTAPYFSGEIHHTGASEQQMEGYCQRYEELLAGVREQESQQQEPGEDTGMDSEQHEPVEHKPAPEWVKGAETAHGLVLRQMDAGRSADQIAAVHEGALSEFDPAKASPGQLDWARGFRETSTDMVQTYRELETAEAERPAGAQQDRELVS